MSSRMRLVLQTTFDRAFASSRYYNRYSVRQGTPTRGKGTIHLLRFRQHALNLLSACSSGSQALMKGDSCEHIETSCSSFP